MTFITRVGCVFVALAVFASQMQAASQEWAVVQGLAPGARVQVSLRDGKTVSGSIDHVTVDAVYLQTKKETVTISRDEISRLYVKKKQRSALIILAGAGAGAAVGGAVGAKLMENENGYAPAVAGSVALFALVGAGVGALARGSGQSLVYKAASKKR